MGFTAACFCAPVPEDEAPEGVKCFVLLLKSYCPQDGLTDAFYIAKNESYTAVKQLAHHLEEMGIGAFLLSHLHLKSIASRCIGLQQGRNTLHYHEKYGSKFCLELLGIDVTPEGFEEKKSQTPLSCESCNRCALACPGGAITEKGFEKEKCIRFYMIGGKPMPLHLRDFVGTESGSYAMIGCDICQRVCPQNRKMEALRTAENQPPFTLEELLLCSDERWSASAPCTAVIMPFEIA